MVGFSAWPIGDWTLKGLEVSDWIEGFISGEAGASVWARGDWVPDEDEISTWFDGSALGGLARWGSGMSTGWFNKVSSANIRLRVNASVNLWEKMIRDYTIRWSIGRFWSWRLLDSSLKLHKMKFISKE
jgi:hypothetical protein